MLNDKAMCWAIRGQPQLGLRCFISSVEGFSTIAERSRRVMDQYTRRIIGFGVHAGKVDGVGLCRMFNRAIREQRWMPKYISSDNDPLYRFHQWQALKDNFQDRGDCQNTRKSATTFVSQNPVRFAGLTGHQS